ncbi:MAG: class I SAM-dependent methyltransferase [bacterium]|nr:class I SAM-dependent methyltransferase [bacterium]
MKDIIRKSYDRDAKNYDKRFLQHQEPKFETLLGSGAEILFDHFPLLDLGCGTGLLSHFLRARNAETGALFGMDLSFGMLIKAQERGIPAVQADIEQIPFKRASFHTVTAFTVLRIIPEHENESLILNEIARVLVPGGLFIVTILASREDPLFEETIRNAGFSVGNRIVCGQDIGYRCIRL